MSFTALVAKEIVDLLRPARKLRASFLFSMAFGAIASAGLASWAALTTVGSPGGSVGAALLAATAAGLPLVAVMAVLMVPGLAAESIAGERERHTLETLLAGPLKDHEIVGGKLTALVVAGAISSLGAAFGFAVAVTVLFGWTGLMAGLGVMIAAPLLQAIPSLILGSMILLLTMRCKTLKDASQRIAWVMLPLILGPQMVFFISRTAQPATVALISIALGVAAVALSLGSVAGVFLRFKRSRLFA